MNFKHNQSSQKLRGGYYTPQNLADYVTSWVLKGNPSSILEPSCGDGVFFKALSNNNISQDIKLEGYELFNSEAKKAKKVCKDNGLSNYRITEGDFLEWAIPALDNEEIRFDGVIGNPPFIRYQFLEKTFQENTEEIFAKLGLKFTKHTNAWVPFIVSSIKLLNAGGRLGMVIPSEIIHVMHAQSLRTYLGEHCSKILIIDPKEIWFENTLQGAVILLAEKKNDLSIETDGVGIQSVQGTEFLSDDPDVLFRKTKAINGQTVIGKWTKAVLTKSELSLINKVTKNKKVYKFKDIANVDVGIVTGANKFFLISDEDVKKFKLQKFSHPMFGRSNHCKGVIYDKRQHQQNKDLGLPSNFIYLDEDFEKLPRPVQDYITLGENDELHTRYKCSIRKPWYKVPSVYSTRIGMLKRAHNTPRLIFNDMEAYTTDTAYRISSDIVDAKKLVYCFINPLTAIYAELEGRYYGGGVLELVPSEIEKLHIPIPNDIHIDLEKLNKEILSEDMSDVLLANGQRVLGQLDVCSDDIEALHAIWVKLKNRRQRK